MTGPPWASLPDGPCRGNFQVNYCLAPSSGGYLNFRLRTRSTTQGFTVHKITQLSVLPSVTHVLQAWCWEICNICFPLIPKALKEFYVKLNQYCKAIFPQLKLKKIQSRDNNLGKKRALIFPLHACCWTRVQRFLDGKYSLLTWSLIFLVMLYCLPLWANVTAQV